MTYLFQNLERRLIDGLYAVFNFGHKYAVKLGLGPAIVIDPALGRKEVRQLNRLLKMRRWREINNILQNADRDDRAFYIGRITDENISVESRPAYFDAWTATEPDNAVAHLVNGFSLVNWGWEARGSGVASTVSSLMFEQFYERLQQAQDVFQRAIALDDTDPEPYVGLISIAMGLSYGEEALWEYFSQLIKRDSRHYRGHSAMLMALTEKWGGTPGAMFKFARETANRAKKGSPLHGLTAYAHVEEWLSYSMDDDDNEEEQEKYFYREDVITEIVNSYNLAFPAGEPAKSDPISIGLLNTYAFCFFHAGSQARDITRKLLLRLGRNANDYPWCYADEPFFTFLDPAYAYIYALKESGLKIPPPANKR